MAPQNPEFHPSSSFIAGASLARRAVKTSGASVKSTRQNVIPFTMETIGKDLFLTLSIVGTILTWDCAASTSSKETLDVCTWMLWGTEQAATWRYGLKKIGIGPALVMSTAD